MDKWTIFVWIITVIAVIAVIGLIATDGEMDSYEDVLRKQDKDNFNTCFDDYRTNYRDCVDRQQAKRRYG